MCFCISCLPLQINLFIVPCYVSVGFISAYKGLIRINTPKHPKDILGDSAWVSGSHRQGHLLLNKKSRNCEATTTYNNQHLLIWMYMIMFILWFRYIIPNTIYIYVYTLFIYLIFRFPTPKGVQAAKVTQLDNEGGVVWAIKNSSSLESLWDQKLDHDEALMVEGEQSETVIVWEKLGGILWAPWKSGIIWGCLKLTKKSIATV